MDIERSLVGKILDTKDIRTAIKSKISKKFFIGESKDVYEFMLDYYGEYSEVPSMDVVQRYFPSYEVELHEDPMMYLIDEMRERRKYNLLVDGVNRIAKSLEKRDTDEALKQWQKLGTVVMMETNITKDRNFTETMDERLEQYESAKKHLGMTGIPYPWKALNETTGGILDEELISLIGFQSVGKSWILLTILYHAWLSGKKVVLFTREMSVEQMQRRLDAIHFRLPYDDFKLGRLGQTLEERYKKKLPSLKGMPDFIVSSDEDGGAGIGSIKAKLEEYQPDIFGIDGAYLLGDDRGADAGWERMMHITQDCKRMCRVLGIPGVITSQADASAQGKHGVTLGGVAFSKTSFGADSDVVIGIDDMIEFNQWKLKLLKQREGSKLNFQIAKDFRTMQFTQVGEVEQVSDISDEMEEQGVIYG